MLLLLAVALDSVRLLAVGKLAIFIERYSIAGSFELDSLLRFKDAAERRGHDVSYLFRPELRHITRYDAVFIRATTDPLNASYVASRVAEMHGIPVIACARSLHSDASSSISSASSRPSATGSKSRSDNVRHS